MAYFDLQCMGIYRGEETTQMYSINRTLLEPRMKNELAGR